MAHFLHVIISCRSCTGTLESVPLIGTKVVASASRLHYLFPTSGITGSTRRSTFPAATSPCTTDRRPTPASAARWFYTPSNVFCWNCVLNWGHSDPGVTLLNLLHNATYALQIVQMQLQGGPSGCTNLLLKTKQKFCHTIASWY